MIATMTHACAHAVTPQITARVSGASRLLLERLKNGKVLSSSVRPRWIEAQEPKQTNGS